MRWYLSAVGQKSDDPLSPASFTSSPKKRKAEQSFDRYVSAKRRKENKDETEAASALLGLACQTDDKEDTPLNPPNTACVNTQIDLTAVGLARLGVLAEDYAILLLSKLWLESSIHH